MADLTGGLGFAGKFLKGFAQGRMYKQQRQMELEDRTHKEKLMKFQETLLKLQAEEKKRQAVQAEREATERQNLLEKVGLSSPAGTGEARKPKTSAGTDLGGSFTGQGDGSLTGEMALQQLTPYQKAIVGKILGYDLLGAESLSQRTGADLRRDEDRDRDYAFRVEKAQKETIPYEEVDPATGIKTTKFRKKYGEPPTGVVSGLPQLKLKTRVDKKTGETVEVPVNRKGEEVGPRTVIEPLKGQSAEASAKISLAYNGIGYTNRLKGMFINPDGSINSNMVLSANAPFGGVGEGRTALATFLDALDARARAATGAAMPESEIKTYMKMYFPNMLDLQNPKTIKDKLERLDSFMTDYLGTLDPSGAVRRSLIKTPEDVRLALDTGLLTKEEAEKMLQEKFGFE